MNFSKGNYDSFNDYILYFNSSKCKLLSIPSPNQTLHSASYSLNILSLTQLLSIRTSAYRFNLGQSLLGHHIQSLQIPLLLQLQTLIPHTLNFLSTKVWPEPTSCSVPTMATTQNYKDIKLFERVQRRATKFILQDYHSGRLINLHLFSPSLWFQYLDISFLIKCRLDGLCSKFYLSYFSFHSMYFSFRCSYCSQYYANWHT